MDLTWHSEPKSVSHATIAKEPFANPKEECTIAHWTDVGDAKEAENLGKQTNRPFTSEVKAPCSQTFFWLRGTISESEQYGEHGGTYGSCNSDLSDFEKPHRAVHVAKGQELYSDIQCIGRITAKRSQTIKEFERIETELAKSWHPQAQVSSGSFVMLRSCQLDWTIVSPTLPQRPGQFKPMWDQNLTGISNRHCGMLSGSYLLTGINYCRFNSIFKHIQTILSKDHLYIYIQIMQIISALNYKTKTWARRAHALVFSGWRAIVQSASWKKDSLKNGNRPTTSKQDDDSNNLVQNWAAHLLMSWLGVQVGFLLLTYKMFPVADICEICRIAGSVTSMAPTSTSST